MPQPGRGQVEGRFAVREGADDDIAVTFSNSAFRVFLGNGTRGFPVVRTFGTALGNNALKIADFNQDGIPDIAVNSGGSAGISVRFGDGDGGFFGSGSVFISSRMEFRGQYTD